MQIDETHWLTDVKRVPSPFCDSRSNEEDISLLVLHHISLPPRDYTGTYIEAFFEGKLDSTIHPFFKVIKDLNVSAHCLIRRNGNIVQFVPFNQRAWHAGVSSFAGRERCNDYSIGIELEGCEFDSYTDTQYQSLIQLTKLIQKKYPQVTDHRITGHQFIAPLRKSDPGLTFDWRHFRKLLNSGSK
ncbi:1,6-anhydro-N-acetylmuramyl-L-alanine amidase ampD [Vibrio nigripulchritudo MADA3029]|uniref:1,6-anhydro-N-acetylmuramyl-L-alanine amidase AmpD n=1 Tax=Vibrio nigripulchritudo TaxID=28173 RepID=UPI0003B19161|nr:1,6-anhydro-N-acetylmuramyl-L-alanine amidase AmpD [Vibrio nigripulchritudo]CCN46915.1 1,6-anhydro-N-acetylmuramyl-L-alanine amidase ampD [Vibrio nigripulchritudo MADA3020]CCN51667.1 1,6-anhydro-N-acetylmuramyl-L-alanine amidase ampD [Vibrio nigripulchritudo MADA3021]CCN57273.1 1,6-anhydro-N-acetylmuramyl-L-alanine amidase ampD [Vibrio nigripulchritudo MADA3029]BDU38575.1 N-acetyl-anhydromuranmyl-L-alanine amidase [Vibrio nigripulchritudo]BDU44297.1 N-acetyl-anhydromuranmyl-L-alanine amidas